MSESINYGNLGKNTFVQIIADGEDLGVFEAVTDFSDSSSKEPVKEHYLGHQNATNIPDTSRDLSGNIVIADKGTVFRDFYKNRVLGQGIDDPYPDITILVTDIDRYAGTKTTDTYLQCILKSKELSRKGDEVKKHNVSWVANELE